MKFIRSLQLLFITLKLAEIGVVKNWSWWLVLSPILIEFICHIYVVNYEAKNIKK
jgi:small Trp-rich protein